MNPDFPFLDETTNGFTYQPFRTKKTNYKKPDHVNSEIYFLAL